MARIAVKGKVTRVFWEGKGVELVEQIKTKSGTYIEQKWVGWFDAPPVVAEGDLLEIKGSFSSKLNVFTDKEGKERQSYDFAVNNSEIVGREPATFSAAAKETDEDLPW